MYLIIPLGGLGTRFKNVGYKLPKPLINVLGKPILYWLLDNLEFRSVKIKKILIPYNYELYKYHFESELIKEYPNLSFSFLPLQINTEGAAETIKITLSTLLDENKDEDCPILSLDGDNFYTCDILQKWNGKNKIFVFEDNSKEAIYSYIQEDHQKNKITNIMEKEKISDKACTGAYGFSSWKNLLKYCSNIIENNIRQKNEYYTSTVIKKMIEEDYVFQSSLINIENFICLGTPLHVRIFCNNFPRINALNNNNMLKIKRYCFDLDNTLVTYPLVKDDYTTVEPIDKNIKMLRYLKKIGNIIIIYTARRMKTHNGNEGKVLKDIAKITFDTLEKFDIPYDEIYFGKPYADYYIDDKAILAFDDLEKELGFYNSQIDARDFNQVSASSALQIIKKSSIDLSGEIYYYKHIPNEIKDLFPIFINCDDENYTWYEMEKINGIPISKLFLSEEMTTHHIDHIIGSLNRIHSVKENEINIDQTIVYDNYNKKMIKRYNNFDYSEFINSDIVFNEILKKITEYIFKNMAIVSMIHGDPVMTNILINQFGKIKCIDMRGKINDELTIFGDIMYDYAKFYQSLIGYDEILDDRNVSISYKTHLISHFKNIFIKKFNEEYWEYLQYITASLLFSLIPLHNNLKCQKYYQLIFKLIKI